MAKKSILIIVALLAFSALIIGGIFFLNKEETYSKPKDTIGELVLSAVNSLDEQKLSSIISSKQTKEDMIAVNFVDLSSERVNDRLLNLLNQNDIQSTFFVSAITAVEDAEFLKEAHKNGHKIGSLGIDGKTNLDMYAKKDLVSSFVRAKYIIENQIINNSYEPLLYCKSTEYTNKLLEAAYASGHNEVVQSEVFLNYKSFKSFEEAQNFINKLPSGTILTIKLDGELTDMEYKTQDRAEKIPEDAKYDDRQAGLDTAETSEDMRLEQVLEWVTTAIKIRNTKVVLSQDINSYVLDDKKDDNSSEIVYLGSSKNNYTKNPEASKESLRDKNKGKLAQVTTMVYTTENAVSFSFYGVSNANAVDNVLNMLDKCNIKATFFVSSNDLKNYKNSINSIVQNGHELQMILLDSYGTDFTSVQDEILKMKSAIKSEYNQDASYIKYPYETNYKKEVLEAISATNTKIVGQDLSVSSSKISKDATSEDIYNKISNEGNIALKRGEIVYFRMDYYTSDKVIAELLEKIKSEKVDNIAYIDNGVAKYAYEFKTIKELLESEYTYTPSVLQKNSDISLDKGIKLSIDEISKKYIGSPFAVNEFKLPGFTQDEIEKLDKTGKFTDEKVMFLSFDDWGSDKAVNHLLYILDKHNIKATFFVRTNYVDHNPNLLRAIAENGHEIASHTDEHMILADTTSDAETFIELSESDVTKLKKDVVLSYEKLYSIAGDVYVNGKQSLSKNFRPPTLAVSKAGMEAILEVGYSNIVSGDFTTQDYEAKSAKSLIDTFINGRVLTGGDKSYLQDGSVVIMHMSDQAKYTAEALDYLIPYYKAQGYTFAKISDYLK